MQLFSEKQIDKICKHLTSKYETRDPFRIAKELGVYVEFDELETLKGYYCVLNRVRMIVINNSLDEQMQKLVCAHELGHDRLHYSLAVSSPLRDSGFISNAIHEIEANRFASGLLLSDEDVLEYASYGFTTEQIAAQLETYPEIVSIKIRTLRQKGIQLRIIDMPCSDFLGRL